APQPGIRRSREEIRRNAHSLPPAAPSPRAERDRKGICAGVGGDPEPGREVFELPAQNDDRCHYRRYRRCDASNGLLRPRRHLSGFQYHLRLHLLFHADRRSHDRHRYSRLSWPRPVSQAHPRTRTTAFSTSRTYVRSVCSGLRALQNEPKGTKSITKRHKKMSFVPFVILPYAFCVPPRLLSNSH